MSVDDDAGDRDVPALPEPKNVSLRGDDCPEPEDVVENSRENRLVTSTFRRDGETFHCFRERGERLSLGKKTNYLASTEVVTDLQKWA